MDHQVELLSGVFCFSLLGLCILCSAAALFLLAFDLIAGEDE